MEKLKWIENKKTTDAYRQWSLTRDGVVLGGVEHYKDSADFYFWIEATGETYMTASLERAKAGLEKLIEKGGL